MSQKKSQNVAVLIIGIGNMGSALVKGVLASAIGKTMQLSLYDQHLDRAQKFVADSRVSILPTLEKASASSYDVIILATKPQDLAGVAALIAGKIKPTTLVVTLLAAVTTDDVAKELKFNGSVVRAMPNIAATVGEAATAMCRNSRCSDAQAKFAQEIFASVGTSSWTKENLMDAVTGLSGSGPAYIYMVIEALTDGGVKMGLPRPLALELATQTVVGSGKLVQASGLHPAVLRDQVTTPGGTTITAIHELEAHGLRAMLMQAVETATEKSKVLRERTSE